MSGVSQIQGAWHLGSFIGLVVWGGFVWFWGVFWSVIVIWGWEGGWLCFDFFLVWFLMMDFLKRKCGYLKHADKVHFPEQNQNHTRSNLLCGQSRACSVQFSAPFSHITRFPSVLSASSPAHRSSPKPNIQPLTSASFSDKEEVQFIKAAQTPEHISKWTSRCSTVTAFVSLPSK